MSTIADMDFCTELNKKINADLTTRQVMLYCINGKEWNHE